MDLGRYARHLRTVASGGIERIVADSLRVMGPRARGYARKAAPVRTGLLRSSMSAETTANTLQLYSAKVSATTDRGIKEVEDYAAEQERRKGFTVASLKWANVRIQGLIRKGMRKMIASQAGEGAGI